MTDKVPTPEEAAKRLHQEDGCTHMVWEECKAQMDLFTAALRTQREALPEGHECNGLCTECGCHIHD